MDFDSVERCDNCCSSLLDDHSENKEPTKKLKIKSNFCETIAEIQIWNALEFIYGISWESFQNYQLGKKNSLLNSQEDIKFCSSCASLLSANYNTHQNFENACRPSSLVKFLKEFRNNTDNCPATLPEKLVCNPQGEERYGPELVDEETMESYVKEEDFFDNFTFEETEDDVISAQEFIETKYEAIPPASIDKSISYKPESNTVDDKTCLSRKATLRSRNLVIKAEKLSPEEIIRFTKTEAKRRVRKKTPTTLYNIDNIPNVAKIKKGTKKLSEAEFQKRVAEALEKITDKNTLTKIIISGQYICSFCGKSFTNFSTLKYTHWGIHTTGKKRFVCDLCGIATWHVGPLKHHKIRKHATEEEKNKWKIKCNICEAFVYKFDLRTHLSKSHTRNPQKEKYKCEDCNAEYVSKQSFSQHILTHTEGPQQCDVCAKFLPSSVSLEHHKNKVHGKKNFSCEKCSKSFVDLRRLRDHEISHEDVRKHVCDECGKSFKYSQQFYTHLKCHRDIHEKGEGAFTCDLCNDGKPFKHSASLSKHKKRMHFCGKKIQIHQCSFCEKRLSSQYNLRVHEKMHIELPGFKPRVRQKLPGHMTAIHGDS